MTSTPAPLHEQQPIRSEDHNKGLHEVAGTVTRIDQVTAGLHRLTVHVPGLPDDPTWLRPNVSLRIVLGAELGDVTRVYTVRSASVETSSIEVDVVMHDEQSSPMMRWMRTLQPGHPMEFRGPRPHFQVPRGGGRPVVVFADDTAIPALYAIMNDAEVQLRGTGWIATDDLVAFDELPQTELFRLERIAPGTGFEAQLREAELPADVVVWGAGERDEMRAVRSHFRKALGLDKDDCAVYGYWKRGTSNTEIDAKRLAHYTELLERGGTVAEMDDLAIGI